MNTNSVEFFKNQETDSLPESYNIILAVWEPGNPENIGRIIRLGHNVGAKKVLFIQKTKNFRVSKIKKTAGFSYDQMEWDFIGEEDFQSFIDNGYHLVILETCNEAKNIFNAELPDKALILAGSESRGLPAEVIKNAPFRIFIPMPGGCKSLNVTHALTVAAFEWYRQKSKS